MERHLDGQCIGIFKIAENHDSADYIFCAELWVPDENRKSRFRPHQTNFGRIRIEKNTGLIQIVYSMPEDVGDRRASAAGYKLKQHWKQGNFPKGTMYASG